MRAKLVDYLIIKHDNEIIEIESIYINKEEQNQDYIALEINNIKMTLSKKDWKQIIKDFNT